MLKFKILLISLAIAGAARAQIYTKPNNSYGTTSNRVNPDSTLHLPTGCGIPIDSTFLNEYGGQNNPAKAAQYYDSCGHHQYDWDPAQKAWHCVDCATGSGGSSFSMHALTSSNFSTSTDCPIPALNNDSLQIFWNDVGRFLVEGTEWQNYSGGGFSILIPGFNASTSSYSLTLYANNVASPPGPVNFTSSNFTSSVNCPIAAYNGMTLQIFWNDAQRYLVQGIDWTPLAGGGFTITISGFDATTSNYSFYVFAQ